MQSERGHYDAVVIGSGFGGAAAAYRLIREGLRVLVLERGVPYPPGSFARTPHAMRRNFWDPAAGLHGLYELWAFRHVRAMVASGLGGGSLIYANVALRKPADTFGADGPNGFEAWPISAGDLDADYAEAEEILAPQRLPDSFAGTAVPPGGVPKTAQFMRAARDAGLAPQPAPIAVSFRAPGADPDAPAQLGVPFDTENLHGVPRHTCTLVGECDLGCNQGAKNSVDFTYLDRFLKAGEPEGRARIFTCCEATRIERHDGGYRVHYVEHAAARSRVGLRPAGRRLLDPDTDQSADTWTRAVTAAVVVIAAGTFGSTRLLLASRPGMPRLSPQLGRRFSTNGDLLTFARNCRDGDGSPRDLQPSLGPTITAYAEDRSAGQRLWMQDAGGPALSEWMWQAGDLPRNLWALARDLLRSRGSRRGGRISAMASDAMTSTASSSAMLPMLAMGRDTSGGRFALDGDGLSLDWDPGGESAGHFEAAERLAGRLARELGGRLGPPGFAHWSRGLTAHPLGGCPMGADIRTGVVDGHGQVFGYPGLFVADGSVMPGPVGPNPSLTIAALGGRAGRAAAERGAG